MDRLARSFFFKLLLMTRWYFLQLKMTLTLEDCYNKHPTVAGIQRRLDV